METDLKKVITALENCTAPIKCRDCPWEECESEHEKVELPKDLALVALGADGSDSAKYKLWGNGIALPCAEDVLGRIARELRKS